jgi:hypothetical protein
MKITIEGKEIDTDLAVNKWPERTGSKLPTMKPVPLGEQRTLYRWVVGGRFYLVHTKEGQEPWGEFVSSSGATTWLIANGYEIPAR